MSELSHLSATEALRRFSARTLSPAELLDSVLERIDEVNPVINAFAEEFRDQARADARVSEARYAVDDPRGPLDGVPFAFKEEQQITGRLEQDGSLLLKNNVATTTHPVVERVLAAGAVAHGRTTTPEFSLVPWTHSKLWGVTRNPWNPAFSPGGSSGGAAAALAAGATTLASGSDIGGSIRLPASFCGLIGFKPPFGRVPGLPPFNQDTYCADGPMGRTVADVALLQNVLAGPHSADQASLRPAYLLPDQFEKINGLRIALCINLGAFAVDPVVETNTREVAAALREAGAIVEEVTLPWTAEKLSWVAWSHFGGLVGDAIREVPRIVRGQLMPYTRAFARRAARQKRAHSLAETLSAESELYRPLGAILDRHDALIAPTFAGTGYRAGVDHTTVPIPVGDVLVRWDEAVMTVPFNIFGRTPVLNVPSGVAPNRIPTGVQIVGRTYDDVTPFRIGMALEQVRGLWREPGWWPDVVEHSPA